MEFLQEMHARGLVSSVSDEAGLYAHLQTPGRKAYIGFDPTKDSLSVGSLLPIMMLRSFQLSGHIPVVLCGGGTGLIGDPSGKSLERPLLTQDEVAANVEAQKKIFEKLLDFDGTYGAQVLNNIDWLGELDYLDVLRDIGKHMSVFSMFAKDSVRTRQAEGGSMSYAEFSYQLLQSYDFAYLHERGVTIQMGGSDQWGNITSGLDLIRKMSRSKEPGFGLTAPLLLDSDGNKMGKSAGGAVYLSSGPGRTPPYSLYQYFINLDDETAEAFLPRMVDLPLSAVGEVLAEFRGNPRGRAAQRAMAQRTTELLYGAGVAAECAATARLMYGTDLRDLTFDDLNFAKNHIPLTQFPASTLADSNLVDVLAQTGLATSKSDARRLLQSGGLSMNGAVVGEASKFGAEDLLHDKFLLLRKGARNWAVLEFAD